MDNWLIRRVYPIRFVLSSVGGLGLGAGVVQLVFGDFMLAGLLIIPSAALIRLSFLSITQYWGSRRGR